MPRRRSRRTLLRRFLWFALEYLLACVVLGVGLGHISVRMPRRPLTEHAEVQQRWAQDFGAQLEEAHMQAADGATLHGWYAAPAAANGRGVILLHGIGDNRVGMSGFADMFLAQGYAVLVPDSRAHGESGGEIATYGVLEREDVHRWAAWLRARAPGCTYLLGESMGAAIGLQAAAVTPQLCAVAVEDPYAHFRELAPERMGRATHTGTPLWQTLLRPVIEVAIWYARLRYGVWLPDADPMHAVVQSHVPTLLITGTKDFNIPMHHAEELERACASQCMLWVVPGADHGGASSVAPGEFDGRVLTWFATHDASVGSGA